MMVERIGVGALAIEGHLVPAISSKLARMR
jgi:hypothetical protein